MAKRKKNWKKVCPCSSKESRELTANLVTFTPFPFRLIYASYFFIKHNKSIHLDDFATDEQFNFVLQLLKEDWCGLLEMPTFVWYFVLPRSLHAQVRTHRHWSFFSESHQLRLASEFASRRDYFPIPKPPLDSKITNIEIDAMHCAQNFYKALLDEGVLPSLARGVLPIHVNLGLTGGCNLRSLFQTIILRNCDILQGTYWKPLLEKMKNELCEKVDERFKFLFELRPCDINNRCLSKIEQELRINKKDPHDPCSIFLKRFKK